MVRLIEDELVDDESFGPSLAGLFIFIDDIHHGFFIGDCNARSVFDVLFFRDIDDDIGSDFREEDQLVEIGAFELDRTRDFSADKSCFRIEPDFDFFGFDRAAVDLFDGFDACFARILFTVFLDESFEIVDGKLLDVLEVFFNFFKILF